MSRPGLKGSGKIFVLKFCSLFESQIIQFKLHSIADTSEPAMSESRPLPHPLGVVTRRHLEKRMLQPLLLHNGDNSEEKAADSLPGFSGQPCWNALRPDGTDGKPQGGRGGSTLLEKASEHKHL